MKKAIIFTLVVVITLSTWFIAINLLGIETTYDNAIYLLTHLFVVAVSMGIGIFLIRKQKWNLAYVGVRNADSALKSILYSLPLYAILLLPLLATGFTGIEYRVGAFTIAIFVILFHLTVVIHEEFYFRGIVLSLFKNNPVKAVLISAFLFSILHLLNLLHLLFNDEIIFSGFFLTTLIQVARTFGLGIIFAAIVIKTKSLMPVVLFHWIGNSLNRIIYFPNGWFVLAQSVLYTIYGVVLMVMLLRESKSQRIR